MLQRTHLFIILLKYENLQALAKYVQKGNVIFKNIYITTSSITWGGRLPTVEEPLFF